MYLPNKPVCLGLSVLELSKILLYEFWYDYVKPIYEKKKSKIVLNGYSFIIYIKINDIYKNVAEDIETRFDNSNYELERPKQQSSWINEDELDGKIMTKFVRLREKENLNLEVIKFV